MLIIAFTKRCLWDERKEGRKKDKVKEARKDMLKKANYPNK